jgi:protein-S-isoprenylcysteine O-methyltransferase Ste14
MKPSPGSAEQRWWYRHAWITVIACGLLGALIFFAVVHSMMSDEQLGVGVGFEVFGAVLPPVGLVLSTMAACSLGFWPGCC